MSEVKYIQPEEVNNYFNVIVLSRHDLQVMCYLIGDQCEYLYYNFIGKYWSKKGQQRLKNPDYYYSTIRVIHFSLSDNLYDFICYNCSPVIAKFINEEEITEDEKETLCKDFHVINQFMSTYY